LTATPATGFSFVRWTKNGTQVSTNPTYTFTVTESAAYVAQFQVQLFQVTTNCNPTEGGTASGSGLYAYGQSCTVNATPNRGYDFINWTENGNVISTEASYTFNVMSGRILTANFELQTFEVKLSVNPEEAAIVSGEGTYSYGDEVTVTVERFEDWDFQNWTENGEVVSEEQEYTFTATANRNLMANLMYTQGVGEQSGNSVVIYPNPVKDVLTVEAKEAIGTVEIYNLMGALVYSQKDCANKVEIHTSDLNPGIYFIRLTNDKVSETRRFVKE
jgi:hypothetical protein